MVEQTALPAETKHNIENRNVFADYDYWFTKDGWNLLEAAALFAGLNPEVVYDPAVAAAYEDTMVEHPVIYQLWQYSENHHWDWREAPEHIWGDLRDNYCANQFDRFTNNIPINIGWDEVVIKPYDFIQWAVDENYPFHYLLHEYLEATGYDFRFSKNSQILNELKIYGKKDVWFMPYAARMILRFSPESSKLLLSKRKNLYRYLDPNYNHTQQDEVYHVMELALESWKTKNLEFFEIFGDDPEANYYNDEECGVHVESKKFVKWAIEKGFKPPSQLLEIMGMKPVDAEPAQIKPERNIALPSYWLEFSDASGELVLNDIFVLAKPTPNEQNYRIIKYLIANPNRFVTSEELESAALQGKSLDKRLTDFAAQIGLCKDLGRLFLDTAKDSIRLNNPVSPKRMEEQNVRRVRIKPN